MTIQKFSGNITTLNMTINDDGQIVRKGTFNGYAHDNESNLLVCSIIAETDEQLALLGINMPRDRVTIKGIYEMGYIRPTAPVALHYNDPAEIFVNSGEIFSINCGIAKTELGLFTALKDISLSDVTAAYDIAFPRGYQNPSSQSIMIEEMQKAALMSPAEGGTAVTTLHIDSYLSFPCTFSRTDASEENDASRIAARPLTRSDYESRVASRPDQKSAHLQLAELAVSTFRTLSEGRDLAAANFALGIACSMMRPAYAAYGYLDAMRHPEGNADVCEVENALRRAKDTINAELFSIYPTSKMRAGYHGGYGMLFALTPESVNGNPTLAILPENRDKYDVNKKIDALNNPEVSDDDPIFKILREIQNDVQTLSGDTLLTDVRYKTSALLKLNRDLGNVTETDTDLRMTVNALLADHNHPYLIVSDFCSNSEDALTVIDRPEVIRDENGNARISTLPITSPLFEI